MQKPLFVALASSIQALENCQKSGNSEWAKKHTDRILTLVEENMPHGSGFDKGTQIDLDASTSEKLVFDTAFHHMDEHGYYDGWTDHRIVVRPLFGSFGMRIGGRDRKDIKEIIGQNFDHCLETVVES